MYLLRELNMEKLSKLFQLKMNSVIRSKEYRNGQAPQVDLEGMQNFRRRATSHWKVVNLRKMNHLTIFELLFHPPP